MPRRIKVFGGNMTSVEDLDVPKGKIVKKLLLSNKDEVFYSNEASERIKEKHNINISSGNFRYHADKLVEKNTEIDKFKISEEEVVWGYSEAIDKVKKRFEL